MSKLNILKTTYPDETFQTPEEWMDAIGAKSNYRHDGSSIAREVSVDDWIFINRIVKNIPVFGKGTWESFLTSSRKY